MPHAVATLFFFFHAEHGIRDGRVTGFRRMLFRSPVSLAFLTRYPAPALAARLGEKRMTAFPVKNGYSGRRTAAELLARLHAAPAGTAGETLTEALRDAVLALVAVLTALNTGVKDLDR